MLVQNSVRFHQLITSSGGGGGSEGYCERGGGVSGWCICFHNSETELCG